MTRITLWFFDARVTVVAASLLLLTGCLTDDGRKDPPPLVLSPSSAIQGEQAQALILSAENLDLKACSNNPDALTFHGSSNKQAVTVHRIDDPILEKSGTRAFVSIEANAPDEEYRVEYTCNETTTLVGTFVIEPVGENVVLTFSSNTISAGAYDKTLEINATSSTDADSYIDFFSDSTELIFGTGQEVKVLSQTLVPSTDKYSSKMRVGLEVDPLTPLKEMTVTANTAGKIATGTLTITDRLRAIISVSPSEVERQATNVNEPVIQDLTIEGEGIAFIEYDPESGMSEEDATRVDFPENPGITVINKIDVVDITRDGEIIQQVKATIKVDDLAKIGGTPLRLTTGDREAYTQMTVLHPADTPYLDIISPKTIPRNGKPTPVFAETINLTLEDFVDIVCFQAGCKVSDPKIDPETNTKISFSVTVDKSFELDFISLHLTTETSGAKAQPRVGEPDAVQLSLKYPEQVLRQGDRNEPVYFDPSGMSLVDSPVVAVEALTRSGLDIQAFVVDEVNDELWVTFNVAKDAPVGTAYLRVTTKDHVLEAPLRIEPIATGGPRITCSPGATLKKRDIVHIQVSAVGFTLPESPTDYRFDDPGLRVVGVTRTDDENATLSVDVSPKARTDMAVLYVKGEDGHAAATFRVLDFPKTPVLKAVPPVVDRTSRVATVKVDESDGVEFNLPVVGVADNIGAEVKKISLTNTLVFDVELEEIGYGGFTGIVIRDNSRTYLMLLEIKAGFDTALTSNTQPGLVYPGSKPQLIELSLPAPMSVDESVLDVLSNLAGTFATDPRPDEDSPDRKIGFYLDVSYDVLDNASDQIPIYVTTASGAAVAFLDIAKEPPIPLTDGGGFNGAINTGRPTTFVTTSASPPVFVQFAFAGGAGEGEASLISSNKLDVAATLANDGIWIFDDAPSLLSVFASPEDNPVQISVKSMGTNPSMVPESSDTIAWILSESPCDNAFLGKGAIDGALDKDIVFMGAVSCELVAAVHARSLAKRPWETPDMKMTLLDDNAQAVDENLGYPTRRDPDPLLIIDEESTGDQLALEAELGSAGDYLINVRRPHLIREISREDTAFIELLIGPSNHIDELSLTLIDATANQEVDTLDLIDAGITDPGIYVIASGTMAGATVVHPVALLPRPGDGAFAVVLKQGETIIDAVQVGNGTSSHGEGTPIQATNPQEHFVRVADLDSDNNDADFAAAFISTPGM